VILRRTHPLPEALELRAARLVPQLLLALLQGAPLRAAAAAHRSVVRAVEAQQLAALLASADPEAQAPDRAKAAALEQVVAQQGRVPAVARMQARAVKAEPARLH
jgi:hypothetical protein